MRTALRLAPNVYNDASDLDAHHAGLREVDLIAVDVEELRLMEHHPTVIGSDVGIPESIDDRGTRARPDLGLPKDPTVGAYFV